MSNVKKGDLAISTHPVNAGTLMFVEYLLLNIPEASRAAKGYSPTEPMWCTRLLQAAEGKMWNPEQTVVALKPGDLMTFADRHLRPLHGDPPAEVERIGDTQPSDVEVLK